MPFGYLPVSVHHAFGNRDPRFFLWGSSISSQVAAFKNYLHRTVEKDKETIEMWGSLSASSFVTFELCNGAVSNRIYS